jgi:outer membrane receptor protein involved in Fe transport
VRYESAGVDSVIVKNQPPIFRIGANVQAGKNSGSFFRGSWGQGFRIPSIGEKYIAQQFTGSLFIVPNDTLKTETSWNMEIGFRQMFKIKKWVGYFDACVFWEQQKNYIQYTVGLFPNTYANGKPIFPDSDLYDHGVDILGLKPFNVQSTRVAGYELTLAGQGKMGPLDVKTLMGYTYTYPGQETPGENYPLGQFLKDVFIYNFKRVPSAYASAHLEQGMIRQLVRADIEFSLWKVYWGATLSYASTPEAIPPLFAAASSVLFTSTTGTTGATTATYYTTNNANGQAVIVVTNAGKSPTLPNELINYYNAHLHGDAILDLRVGMKLNDQIKLGFIIKNVGNVFYELRPGLPEPNRNYTLQFTYSFGRTKTKKS